MEICQVPVRLGQCPRWTVAPPPSLGHLLVVDLSHNPGLVRIALVELLFHRLKKAELAVQAVAQEYLAPFMPLLHGSRMTVGKGAMGHELLTHVLHSQRESTTHPKTRCRPPHWCNMLH